MNIWLDISSCYLIQMPYPFWGSKPVAERPTIYGYTRASPRRHFVFLLLGSKESWHFGLAVIESVATSSEPY